jgi:hypothetical protein
MQRWLLGGKVPCPFSKCRLRASMNPENIVFVTAYGFMHGVMNTDK